MAEFLMAKKLDMRFFFVVATNGQPPFTFYEYDLTNGVYTEFSQKLDYDKFNNTLKKYAINNYWQNVLKLMN
jgi:hypothetical protein